MNTDKEKRKTSFRNPVNSEKLKKTGKLTPESFL
jgi:hypothetical protein